MYLRVTENGNKKWLNENYRLHRLGGPALIWDCGSTEWYAHGLRHRLDGPAVTWVNVREEWYINGDRHRLDGPAVEWADGRCEWWVDGRKILEQDHPFIKLLKKYRLYSKWKRGTLTEAERVLIKLSVKMA